MKRSLILLLAVALLATMVPTIALAADATTPLVKSLDIFTVAMPDITGYLSRAKKNTQQQYVLQTSGTQNTISKVSATGGKTGEAGAVDSSMLKVVWTTSDRNIAGFMDQPNHNTFTQYLEADGNTPFPEIDGRAVGDVVFTGKAYWAGTNVDRYPAPLATVSFNVHILPVWETKVTIKDRDGKEQEKQSYEYWLIDTKKAKADKQDIYYVTEIPEHGQSLESKATVHSDPNVDEDTENKNNWAATYGVGELTWTSSDESIAKVDKHGRIWFSGKAGTVTIRATAKEEAKYPHTPKYAEITYTIHGKTTEEETSYEAFKKVEFTADELDVKRGCSKNWVNIARFLELYPRPVEWYQQKGGEEHQDVDGGNYGVDDGIIWSSSNENLMWICRDADHYNNGEGPNWQECYVEVSADAKPGDKVTITATSRNNPNLSDTIVLVLKVDDTETAWFERTAVTVRVGRPVDVKVNGTFRMDPYVTLTSANPDIARVNPNLVVDDNDRFVRITGVEPGNTTVTLQSTRYKFNATIDVTVVPANGVKSVTVPERYKNITMPLYDVGEKAEVDDGMNTTRVRVNINPTNAWYRATWTSSDPSVAYIVYDGDADYGEVPFGNTAVVRAAGVGKCKITVTIDDGIKTFKRSMKITVVKAKATKLALNKTKANFYLRKGGDNTLQLIATDAKTDKEVPVTWTTSDKTIAKVNKAGLVTLKKEGTVKITATTKDGYKAEKSCTITVKKLPVKKIVLAAKKANMKVGETGIVVYSIRPAKAYNTNVTFKSSDKRVVSVDKYGVLTAKKAGKAEITITAKDGSGVTAKLIITVKGVADNANIDVIDVVEDDNLEMTLDGIDGIDDLGNEDVVELNANDVIELAID